LLPELVPCVYILLTHILHLMHDVSLRAASNRMDAHNLAIVLCPNLLSGTNPARDVMMCAIPGGPLLYPSAPSTPAEVVKGKTTLGLVIKLCIQRYYEVFDELRDRSEGVPLALPLREDGAVSSETSSISGAQANGGQIDDDEDIDDAMLVMPIGPHNGGQKPRGVAPSAWGAAGVFDKPRYRTVSPGGSSMHTSSREFGLGSGNAHVTMGKSKSMISIEKSGAPGTAGRKGSIAVGRGTMRKSTGAGVEAISITAEGFFSAPNNAPTVSVRRKVMERVDGFDASP